MNTFLAVINDDAHNGAFNMAADELLLRQAPKNPLQITLRFYLWKPAAVSLGYMQNPESTLDLERLTKESIDWVRRPTGGRAIFHSNDLSYSCTFPISADFMGSTVTQTYRIISRCLIRGLQILGINASSCSVDYPGHIARRELKLPCFLSPNREEIMVEGKKLIGSAQKRTAEAVLQHGSIPIDKSYRRLPQYLKLSQSEKETQIALLECKSTCVKEIMPELQIQNLVQAIIEGFVQTLRCDCKLIGWNDK